MQTSPEPVQQLFVAGDDWIHVDLETINQVVGPVWIDGVEPGDGVAVEILDIETLDWGWNGYIPGFSLVARKLQAQFLRKVPIVDGWVHLSNRLKVPVQPMIGCLGLAPATGESTTFGQSAWGGNYDLVQMTVGNTAIFPAQVPGGLFYLGDLHAAMGAGEPTYVSVECAGTVTVRFGVRKQVGLITPRVESSERLYILGLSQRDSADRWEESRRQACELMFDYLVHERGLGSEEAYLLLSSAVDLTYGGPAGVSVASIPFGLLD
jgi:amidase